ncbi:MAG: entericidin [Legionellales bacterium RIFCSPHIGHO2_12_FULL_37_14]|nr:MAG: entericidin [Legionellales bacterium RIFCSPHIGHO2_12_FULL_37_14]
MKNLFAKVVVSLVCFSILTLSACNTVRGVGKDVKRGGQEIERAVD